MGSEPPTIPPPYTRRHHPSPQVRGFPSIRIFKKLFDSEDKVLGTVENFEQKREYQVVVNHMRDLGTPPQEVTDVSVMEDFYLTKAK